MSRPSSKYHITVTPVDDFNGFGLRISVSDYKRDELVLADEKRGIVLTETISYRKCGFLGTSFGASKLRMKRKCERLINKLTDKITMMNQLSKELSKIDGVSRATRRLEKK